jgi:hypothetical protein
MFRHDALLLFSSGMFSLKAYRFESFLSMLNAFSAPEAACQIQGFAG